MLSASDIGLPLGPIGKAALLPTNVAAFAEELPDVSADDVLLYLALREAAHQRLFAGVPWLRDHLIEAVSEYGAGMDFDTSGMEAKLRELDMTNPEAMQDALAGGLFDPEPSTAQKAALEKLEVTLALVEGWVDEVVSQATAERMPAAAKLQETVRRRRAAGGPAEQTFATLVGLELRPRRLRDASVLWGSLRTRQGAEARDGVWMSPHLLPTAADLDDPLGFREDSVTPGELSEEEFDAGLRDLLDGGDGTRTAVPRRVTARTPTRRSPRCRAGSRRRLRRPRSATATSPTWPRTPTAWPRRASPTTSPPARSSSPPTAARCSSTTTARPTRGSPSAATSSPATPSLAGGARRELIEESGLSVVRLRRGAAVARRARGGVLLRPRHRPPPRRTLPGHRRAATPPTPRARSRSTCAGGRSTRCRRRSTTCTSSSRSRSRGCGGSTSAQSSSTPGGGSSRAAAE